MLIAQMAHVMMMGGVPAAQIGIVSPYRSQLRHIKDALGGYVASACARPGLWYGGMDPSSRPASEREQALMVELEISTVDKYQGRDKDVILLSLVRSNPSGKVGRLAVFPKAM